MSKKTFVIFKHGGGELANQLWNYLSISAYGLESKTEVANPSFFEYSAWFNAEEPKGIIGFMSSISKKHRGRRNSPLRKILRNLYFLYSKTVEIFKKGSIVSSENTEGRITYIPPTNALPTLPTSFKVYFKGWLFRNPVGFERYRPELLKKFSPIPEVWNGIEKKLTLLRASYAHIIGVHVRQGDYATFKQGRYLISQQRIREILDEFLIQKGLSSKDTVFVITSDGKIDTSYFENLNITISTESPVTDLFLLSQMDCILGSDSSFGAFAAWYGNIPHIIFKNEPMDWSYYQDAVTFFENKYCSMIRF